MTDRPIIFSAPMIGALLDGRKTQTRRVLKPQPDLRGDVAFGTVLPGQRCIAYRTAIEAGTMRLPYAIGDRLWVREALRMGFDDGLPISQATYAADSAPLDLTPEGALAWAETRKRNAIPSIHMPRWASRLTLTVTDVRVQRVQEISEADAKAEGVRPDRSGGGMAGMYAPLGLDPYAYARGFRDLWNSLHGPDAWDRNPWVRALTFDVHRCNIDKMEGET